MSMHLNIISNQISQMPEVMKFGCAAVLIALILFINSFAIIPPGLVTRAQTLVTPMTNGNRTSNSATSARSTAQDKCWKNVSFTIPRNTVIGIIGPANSGKTTLLKTINRTLDFVGGARSTGDVLIDGQKVADIRNRMTCAVASAWSSRCPSVCRSPFTRTSPTPRAAWASSTELSWTKSSNAVCAKPCFGTK